MKNILYDVVVGAVLFMGLMALVPVMKANQNYIAQSAISKTNNERLTTSEAISEKIHYNILDVYAFYLQKLNTEGKIDENIEIEFNSLFEIDDAILTSATNSSDCQVYRDSLCSKINSIKGNNGNYNDYLCEVAITKDGSKIKYTITEADMPSIP